MPDYSQGKIYKITGNGKVYVGSTTTPLATRLSGHRKDYNKYKNGKCSYTTSYQCLDDPECKIELLEECPCNSRKELETCERKWIENVDCVNEIIPTRTPKEYYEQNKEHQKQYQAKNRQKIAEYHRQYYQARKAATQN